MSPQKFRTKTFTATSKYAPVNFNRRYQKISLLTLNNFFIMSMVLYGSRKQKSSSLDLSTRIPQNYKTFLLFGAFLPFRAAV